MAEEEIYASDEAWKHWFDKCAVKRCTTSEQERLRRQIESAFNKQLCQYHDVTAADYELEDICDLFDIHFYMHGTGDNPKALKSYYRDRINPNDPEGLKKLICGTLLSPRCGRIKDIVRETIPIVKGWKARWETLPDGRKILVWERPLNVLSRNDDDDDGYEAQAIESLLPSVSPDAYVDSDSDIPYWRSQASRMLDFLSGESERRRHEVPILVYAILFGVSPSSTRLQAILGVKQVQCYKKVNKIKEKMRLYFVENEITPADTAIIPALRDAVTRCLGEEVVNQLNNETEEIQ